MNVLKPILLDETGKEIVEALKKLQDLSFGNGETNPTDIDSLAELVKQKIDLTNLKGESGKSAYDFAKEYGFSGTEREFGEKLSKEETEIPASLPASDVYAWAKAPVKPNYTAQEVGALSKDTVIPDVSQFVQKSIILLLLEILKSAVFTSDKASAITNVEKLLKGQSTDQDSGNSGESSGDGSGGTDTDEIPDKGDSDDTDTVLKSNENEWYDGVAYDLDTNAVKNFYLNGSNFAVLPYDGWEITAFLNCAGASRLELCNQMYTRYGSFYSEDKQILTSICVIGNSSTVSVEVPENASYFKLSYPCDFVRSPTAWRPQDGKVIPFA